MILFTDFRRLFYDFLNSPPKSIGIRWTIEKARTDAHGAVSGSLQGAVRQSRAMKARTHADPVPIQRRSKHVRGNA